MNFVETSHKGMTLTLVGTMPIPLNAHLATGVGHSVDVVRTVIDDDNLVVGVFLVDQRENSSLEQMNILVERGDNDRYHGLFSQGAVLLTSSSRSHERLGDNATDSHNPVHRKEPQADSHPIDAVS